MKISSVAVDDRIIRLNQEALGIPNIFGIDSVSLIIGNNGSGKTFFLNRILDKFTVRTRDDRFSCEIKLESGRRLTYSEMRNQWGAIYYSPIPYGRRIHSTKNLIDASPNWSKPLSIFDLKVHEDILHEFKISPKVYARQSINARKICLLLVDLLIVKTFPNVRNDFLENAGSQLIDFLDKAKTIDVKRFSTDEMVEKENVERKLIEKAASNIYQGLMDIVNDELKALCIFVVLERYADKGSKGVEMIKHIVNELLYAQYLELDYSMQKNTKAALEDINRLVIFFKHHSYNLKMGARGFIEAELDGYDQASLEAWGVENLLEVGFQNMSSGQMAILAQLSKISNAIKKFSDKRLRRILLLIDEGDAFLHLEWQRKYISQLNQMLSKLKHEHAMDSIQLILATHSPLLATDVPKDFICRMEATGSYDAPSAFAAPLHELLSQSFGAKTVGEFASEKINEVVRNAKQDETSKVDGYIISSIDNPIIKAEVMRRVLGRGDLG
ncbi:AAA family ATPase [Pseudomonas monteilii]